MSRNTWSELEAARLLARAGEIATTNWPPVNYHAAGNRIIELAERIKAERAVAAMEPWPFIEAEL